MSGRVQGVFFRQETLRMARQAGVRGWVRNMADGRVEAVFEGPRPAVETLVAWCRAGPRAAAVTDVGVTWGPPTGEGTFRVR